MVFDSLTGKEIWPSAPESGSKVREENLGVSLDRSGRFLTILRASRVREEPAKLTLVESSSGKYLGPAERSSENAGWGPDMPYYVTLHHEEHRGELSLIRKGEKNPVVVLGIDISSSGIQQQFDDTGNRFAWGNVDGTINVCDIPQVQRRLAAVGL